MKKRSSRITVKSKSDPISNFVKVGGIILVTLVVLAGLGVLTGQNSVIGPKSQSSTYSHDDLFSRCIDHATITKHYHWELKIIINDKVQEIPSNVGISSSCMSPIHTHDSSGTVHVELPSGAEGLKPTVGDFFRIWGQIFGTSELLGHYGVVQASINGVVQDAASIEARVPNDGDKVILALQAIS